MDYDHDIQRLLSSIETGRHTIEFASLKFLESLPGYNYRYHQPLTVRSYERCLLRDPHNFNDYMKREGFDHIELVTRDKLEFFKAYVLNGLEPVTAMKFVTSVRQLFKYVTKLEWIPLNIAADYELPKPPKRPDIEVINPEVCELLFANEWGNNMFTRKRNTLILCFFLRRGMHPKELPTIMLEHIAPYRDLTVITVCGKRNRWRDVMLDPVSDKALKEYAIERGKYLSWRGVVDEHLILASNPRLDDGSYAMTTAGVSAVIKRITLELQRQGCLASLKNVTPNIMRHTAESNDWERAEHLPVHHPELSIPNQYGNSLPVALKHYVKHSKRNAYILLKGGSIVDEAKQGNPGALSDMKTFQKGFPEMNSFPQFDVGI